MMTIVDIYIESFLGFQFASYNDANLKHVHIISKASCDEMEHVRVRRDPENHVE